MSSKNSNSDPLNETQALRVINEMIQISQKKLKNDGILFILWGWLMFYTCLLGFIQRKVFIQSRFDKMLENFTGVLTIAAIIFTLYYIWKQFKKVQTYIGISLRYIWISLVISLVFINLIQFNVLHSINFELQHPVFMVVIAFAIVATGGILRYRLIIAGGIIFGLLALTSSYFSLPEQLLIEAIAWVIAFIVPGHVLYSKRNA